VSKAFPFPALAAAVIIACGLLCAPAAAQEDIRSKGDKARGEGYYERYCRGCHGEEGKGDGLVFMPHVDNLTKKGYIENLPDAYLLLAITKGGPGIGKSNYMPSWEGTLSEQQMFDIIAYIRSLPLN
jgi:mono/diheme cytochrome c family protein